MIDKNILIKHLESFKKKDDKYSLKQLAEFLSCNEITSKFFQDKVEKMQQYVRSYPRLIVKYSKDKYAFKPPSSYGYYSFSYKYTEEERDIINNINDEHLIAFWFLNLELNSQFNNINCGRVMLKLAYDVYEPDSSEIEDLIDYIVKFCIIPYSENQTININLTDTEKKVLKYIHTGLSVPQIAEKMCISKCTIENHKKNICAKIKALKEEKEEYKDLKALAKLHLLAQKIFK